MNLISHYTDYGRKDFWDSESPVRCVCDDLITKTVRKGKQVALLIEPRPIQPRVYEYILDHYDEYEYVFTHDSYLLKNLPNAKPILWGNVWCRCANPKKTKLISMTSSDKEMCELHKERKRIARKYKDKIDVYGTIDGGNWCDPIDTLEPYMYSVVIENHIDDIWFTEKICNCFATKTIPIYYGARDIENHFYEDGIINCKSIQEIEDRIDDILKNSSVYELRYNLTNVSGILRKNFELSKQYENFDEWFYKTYEKEIGGLFNNGEKL